MTKRGKSGMEHYLERFEESEFLWLARVYRKQAKDDPDLTVEEFAINEGVEPETLHNFIEFKSKPITLWHGTTDDRLKLIQKDGFRTEHWRARKIWFAQTPNYSRMVAQGRARGRRALPVLLCCSIDLIEYPNFDRPNADHYAFRHAHISQDVIQDTTYLSLQPLPDRARGQVNLTIDEDSGELDVLTWVNNFLGKNLRPTNPLIEEIHEWVQTQYIEGRKSPISDEEMLIQVMAHLKQEDEIGEEA